MKKCYPIHELSAHSLHRQLKYKESESTNFVIIINKKVKNNINHT